MTRRVRRLITCRNCQRPNRPHAAHGWCITCYRRWTTAGRPTGPIPEPNPNRTHCGHCGRITSPHTECCRFCNPTPDPVAIDRALSDRTPDCDVPDLTTAERRAATAALTARGWPAWRIAERLRCTPRTVIRYRATQRATDAP